MTAPAQIPPPTDSSNADEVIAALGALLLAGATVAAATKLLGTLKGLASPLVSAVFKDRKLSKLLGNKVTKPGQKAATSAQIRYVAAQRQADARAAYMVAATLRLVPAHATKDAGVIASANAREDTFAIAHATAAAGRQTAINSVIQAAGKRKPDNEGRLLMGWYAEEHPCPICLLADGTNFDALDPPAIGWPGWVHPHCYCEAGAPHGTDLMVDDVVQQRGASLERRSSMKTETRTAQIVEIRGPGTAKPDARPGFTAKLVAYGVPDSYRTSWQKGVFDRALEQRSEAGVSIPVVWDHNWADPVGQVVAYRDEQDGFYGDIEFDDFDAVPRARQAYAQMQPNPTTGKPTMGQFSFAFARGEEEEDTEHRGTMRQTSVEKIQEFSIVLNGSVPGTGPTATRGRVDARTAADLIERFGRGELELTDALVELRSAAKVTPAAAFEFRAVDGVEPSTIKPLDVLVAVDTAMVGVAEQLDKGEVEAARRYFSQAASRLSELQYALAMVPGVEGYGESYSWRSLERSETRTGKDQAPEHEPFPELNRVAMLDQRTARFERSIRRIGLR